MTDAETVTGLRIVVTNAAVQVQALSDAMTLGTHVREQAETTKLATDLAILAMIEVEPTLRKLARNGRKAGGG